MAAAAAAITPSLAVVLSSVLVPPHPAARASGMGSRVSDGGCGDGGSDCGGDGGGGGSSGGGGWSAALADATAATASLTGVRGVAAAPMARLVGALLATGAEAAAPPPSLPRLPEAEAPVGR